MSNGAEEPDESGAAESLALPGIAGAAAAVLGYRLGGVEGAAVGGYALPYLTFVLRKSAGELLGDRMRRADAMLESAASAAHLPPEEFAELTGRSERTRFLTESAMKAAADTEWPPGIQAIGRALAAGLVGTDDAVIDVPKIVLPAMTDMTAAHVQLLDLLVMARPARTMGSTKPSERIEDKRYLAATKSEWAAHEITDCYPRFEPILTALIATLERHGLLERNDQTSTALNRYSEQFQKESSRGSPNRGRVGTSNPPPRVNANRLVPRATWSPTELGKVVLGYYELAAGVNSPPTPTAGA